MTGRRRLRRALWRAGIVPGVLALVVLGKVLVMMSHDEEGRAAFADTRFDRAAEEFAENRSWNWFEPWVAPFDEGAARHANEQYDVALDHYQTALETVPESEECTVRINLALVHETLGDRAATTSPPNRNEATAQWRAGIQALAEGDCPRASGRGPEQTEDAAEVDRRLRQKLQQQRQQQQDDQQQPPQPPPDQQTPQEEELEERNEEGREDRRDQQEDQQGQQDPPNEPGGGGGNEAPDGTPLPGW